MKTLDLQYIENLNASKKTQKIRKKTNVIKVKGKNFKKDYLSLLGLIQLPPFIIIGMLKIKTKIIYLNKILFKSHIKTITKKTIIS